MMLHDVSLMFSNDCTALVIMILLKLLNNLKQSLTTEQRELQKHTHTAH